MMASEKVSVRPRECTKRRNREKSIEIFLLLVFCFISISYSRFSYVDALDPVNFNDHHTIEPRIIHARHRRSIENTLEENGLHTTHIHLIYEHNNKDVILDLHLNDNLIPIEHFMSYQLPNGDKAIKNFTKTDIELCHYHGKIRNNPLSSVALSTCDGIKGVVFDGLETYYIENEPSGPQQQLKHFLIRHSDLKLNHKCGYEGGNNHSHDEPALMPSYREFHTISRFKRSTNVDRIRGPFNSNRRSNYLELILVVDNKIFEKFDRNLTKIHKHCKDIANIINALYVPLNIFIALQGVVIWNERNLADLSPDGDKSLRSFLTYRKKILLKDHPNDNAQLLTGESFKDGVVGKALKGPICTYEYSGGVSMDHSKVLAIVATTVAHEMGHNFGMEHDSDSCNCPDSHCIMSSASTSVAPTHWSTCSIDQLNLAFSRGMNYCMKNKPEKLFESPVCGNGFVEPGEECDCGLPHHCNNSCCDPWTCRLYSNATCATGECCDLETCKPREAGVLCREAVGECDLPEYCLGENEYCPDDVYKRDTDECKSGEAFCFQGTCRTRNDQCRLLWGPSGESSEQCYQKNLNGSRHGNCGYNKPKETYTQCKPEDMLCGLLQCRHLNERLEFGMESVALLSHTFINYAGSIVPCRVANIDLGLQSIDPGLSPNGAKCGDGKMCYNQKCLAIESLRNEGIAPECPECNGHGICNSKGRCHCDEGWMPPFCNNAGPGGSFDSGPASSPGRAGEVFRKIMLIFFAGVVPACAIFAVLILYLRHKKFEIWRSSPNIPKPNIKHHIAKSTGSPQSPTFIQSSPNSPDDINSSLLRPSDKENNYIFGRAFKNFKPLSNANKISTNSPNVAFVHPVTKANNEVDLHVVPTRIAPPPPIVKNGDVNTKINQFNKVYSESAPPALPPLNKNSTARPLISNPILEASTSDAKEVPPVVKYPSLRAAPVPPNILIPSEMNEKIVPEILINPTSDKKTRDGTLGRIQSFLKKEQSPKVEKIHKQLRVIDRERLRTLEISSPIQIGSHDNLQALQKKEDEKNAKIKRVQSMRDPPAPPMSQPFKPTGSVRQPRPKSIVDRPTNPPPRPPAPVINQSQSAVPLTASIDSFESQTPDTPDTIDNIYSVIDEKSPPPTTSVISSPTPPGPFSQKGSIESVGLLGEIVNEIESRNFESVYIASTMKRKKTNDEPKYENTNDSREISDSSVSDVYMRPVNNTPVARIPPSQVAASRMPSSTSSNSMSSFQSAKSVSPDGAKSPIDKVLKFDGPMKKSSSDLVKRISQGSEYKTPTSNKPLSDYQKPLMKKATTTPSIGSKKPSTLRTRSPSPSKAAAAAPTPNSVQKPQTTKKPAIADQKPSIKYISSKSLNVAAGKNSSVAALQKKFESSKS